MKLGMVYGIGFTTLITTALQLTTSDRAVLKRLLGMIPILPIVPGSQIESDW